MIFKIKKMNRKRLYYQIIVLCFFVTSLNIIRNIVSKTSSTANLEDSKFADSQSIIQVINSVPPVLEDFIEDPTKALNEYESLSGYHDGMASATIPLMLANLMVPDGPILEMGLNAVTTKLLNKIATDYSRSVESMDLRKKYNFEPMIYNKTKNHRIRLVDSSELASYGQTEKWSVVFVDHSLASMRASNLIQFHLNAQILLAHDAEISNDVAFLYEKKSVRTYFKYSCKYSVFRRERNKKKQRYYSTLILSDYVNLKVMMKILKEYKANGYEKVICAEPY
jgi:hypothetical protein